jgi:hypothetical protein
MKMRRTAVLFAGLLLFAVFMNFVPGSQSQEESTEWYEEYGFTGNCSSGNIEHRFQVDRTVVEIVVNLSWAAGGGESDLDMEVRDITNYYVVDTSSTESNPENLVIRDFPNRGRWTLVVVPVACGTTGVAEYTVNLTLHNIVLPILKVSSGEIEEKETVTLNLTSPHEDISHYFFDYGDKTNSGWSLLPDTTKTYNKSGEYTPQARVRYDDGTESDWVEAGEIEVAAEPEGPNMVLWIGFWLLLIGVLSFGLNLAYSKKKGI